MYILAKSWILNFLNHSKFRPRLVEEGVITPTQHKVIRNLYSISSPAIHGDDHKLTLAEMDFVKQIAPGLIDELKKIE